MIPTASIIVTSYNISALLARCAAGLCLQDYPIDKIEIIVADDGSGDNFRDALLDLQGQFRVRVVVQEHHGYRLASLKNLGMLASNGAIIAFLDGDMIPPPQWLSAHVATLAADTILTVSIGARKFLQCDTLSPSDILSDPRKLTEFPEVQSVSNWMQAEDRRLPELRFLRNHPAPYHLFHGCNVAFFRTVAFQAGLMNERFNGHWGYEDTEFAYRMWRCGAQFVWCAEATAFHQENAILSLDDRERGDQQNFELACQLIPGFRDFKTRLRQTQRTPWW